MQTFLNGFDPSHCMLCPRKCGADRTKHRGQCGGSDTVFAARSALHPWEEPCISGTNGSGTIFFCGCCLGCCFCQNHAIQREDAGVPLTLSQLEDCMLQLQKQGAHNINFVTGSHYAPWIVQAVRNIQPQLHIPIVWNSSGYESPEILGLLSGVVDIYLPDFKYLSAETAQHYADAADYPSVAIQTLQEMHRQVGAPVWDADGILQRGMIVRHLVLPAHRHESMALLDTLAEILPKNAFLLSLMGQYTPPVFKTAYKNLNRHLTTMEYESVLRHAQALEFQGFSQERSAADATYIPQFNLEGLPHDTKN
jgi:putative pyruvate formate lyase activating enzyme